MGKIMKNGRSYSGWGGDDGTTVVANPEGTATDTLNKLQVGNEVYSVPSGGGGTTVVANPSGEATDTLTKLQVGNDIFSIPSGGGGVSGPITWVETQSLDPGYPQRYTHQENIQAATNPQVSVTVPYTFTDSESGDNVTVNFTINLESSITTSYKKRDMVTLAPYMSQESSGEDCYINITINSVTADNPKATNYDYCFEGSLVTGTSYGHITIQYPQNIWFGYDGVGVTGTYAGDTQHEDVPYDTEYAGTYQYTIDEKLYVLGVANN